MTNSRPKPAAKSPSVHKPGQKAAPRHKYRLMFLPEALAEYRALDGSVRAVVKQLLGKRLDSPHVPGGALHGDLAGCYKIKLLKHGIRLVYQVEDGQLIVLVLAVDKREDSVAYKAAVARLGEAAIALADTSKAGGKPPSR